MSIAEDTTADIDTLTDAQKVAEFARRIADVLDTFPPDLEAPTHHHIEHYRIAPSLSWLIFNGPELDDQKRRAQAIIRALGGKWDKEPASLFSFNQERNGVKLDVTVEREAVCRRVVTGTREVTRTVPAPDAPMVEVTETVEDVEWECAPLLAEASK